MTSSAIGDASPAEAFAALGTGKKAILIDVRTRAEWTYVGLPDLSSLGVQPTLIEWQVFPAMEINPGFAETAMTMIEQTGATEAYFLCRSGVRSLHAAMTMAEAAGAKGRPLSCFNVVGGFEGDPDSSGHRGKVNGWKAAELPWRQG